MKKMMCLILVFCSFTAMANCELLVGKYLCPAKAVGDFGLNSREVNLGYNPYFKMFVFTNSGADLLYELNNWNPGISTNGDIDFSLRTIGICSDSALTLRNEITEEDEDIKITIMQDWNISKIKGGIKLRSSIDGDEFFNFNCKNI